MALTVERSQDRGGDSLRSPPGKAPPKGGGGGARFARFAEDGRAARARRAGALRRGRARFARSEGGRASRARRTAGAGGDGRPTPKGGEGRKPRGWIVTDTTGMADTDLGTSCARNGLCRTPGLHEQGSSKQMF